MKDKAELVLFHEFYQNVYIKIRISVWRLPEKDWERYPIKFKYSLICINVRNNKKVLMDNHHPKGPHLHLDYIEFDYNFRSVRDLLVDFKNYCRKHMEIKL